MDWGSLIGNAFFEELADGVSEEIFEDNILIDNIIDEITIPEDEDTEEIPDDGCLFFAWR